jgi:hypothetical protein
MLELPVGAHAQVGSSKPAAQKTPVTYMLYTLFNFYTFIAILLLY